MKIYTKTGDGGETSLIGGARVPKHHQRIKAYGTFDELNAYLGLIKDQEIDPSNAAVLLSVQKTLFVMGAMLATPPDKAGKIAGIQQIDAAAVKALEEAIDQLQEKLPKMTHFILPGGHTSVSFCHIARCICRRAERNVTELRESCEIDQRILVYLNRLSDYLFVLARSLGAKHNAPEIKWIP